MIVTYVQHTANVSNINDVFVKNLWDTAENHSRGRSLAYDADYVNDLTPYKSPPALRVGFDDTRQVYPRPSFALTSFISSTTSGRMRV